MKINRVWAMPNKWTFTIKPIKHVLDFYVKTGDNWADPFSGKYSPAEFTNDLNPKTTAKYHIEAIDFLKMFQANSMDGVLFDPPYSPRQVKECYEGIGLNATSDATKMSFYSNAKNEMARIIKPGGYAICFGWNSMGLGINRKFKLIEVLLVPHGGSKNDTIVTVERKLPCD